MIIICSILMIITGIIFSNIDMAVFHTLTAAAILQSVIVCITNRSATNSCGEGDVRKT